MTEDVKQSRPKESHQLTDVYFGPEKGGEGGGVGGRGSPQSIVICLHVSKPFRQSLVISFEKT